MAFFAAGMSVGWGALDPAELVPAAIKAKTLPDAAAWRMDLEVVKGSDKPGWNVKSITSTRFGNIQKDVILWNDGKTSEAWWMGGDYLANDPRTDAVLYSPEKKPLSLLGWISWIDGKNFRGMEKRDAGQFAVFAATVPWSLYWPGYFVMDSGGPPLEVEALFSPEDARLVSVRYNNVIARITWLPAPTEALVPPGRFAQKQKTIRDRIAKKFRDKGSAD